MSYLDAVRDLYDEAAASPMANLCCVPSRPAYYPGLHIPDSMIQMNYGCGATVHPQDLGADQTVLYVGVGGGLELLQFAWFTRAPGSVIGVDPVERMRDAARRNLDEAAATNDWFDPSFVDLRDGDALALPIDDASIDVAAQNCLFNIFKRGGDLETALREMHRALKRGGRLTMSDPITPRAMPDHLERDARLRAMCISGCLTYDEYIGAIVDAGFGAIEVRSRRPYRLLDPETFGVDEPLLLETIEVAAFKVPVPDDGPCVFTGRYAVYAGPDERFDDGRGHVLERGLPLPVCDKTAGALAALGDPNLLVTESTWHYGGGGCC
ncbi:MAG: arsenosugar biosynthesis arsenite methyltransferase ArsM [Phycisphaerales bacterium]